ncbi:uncharacterized protein (TIGR02246 family) [Mucilaginibacter frigoritolerans]|uniref:Uncharacterized protein (TIGR02246 family) n=1 Tax=Mucilaginibacter frigoritolerans TaxID=652788 RepID=A0A562UBM2_9SPHI|nr:SgcJ/EcaC family oxidoreductase [Mucilaginibacter frigoritolerans]TWJ03174.1 uncharacterized protein (TIGR02246 family) [Mucilaginibacter frigoritolerans]
MKNKVTLTTGATSAMYKATALVYIKNGVTGLEHFCKTNRRVCLLIFLAIILSNTSFGQSSKDEQLVKNVVLAYQDDYNDGAFKNVESYTTKNWEHINPIGGITKGRDEVMKELRPLCQTILKGVTLTVESMTVRFLSPTVAIANVVHKCSDYEFPAGVKHQNERHMKTYIIVKKQNKWLLILDQNTIIVAH